MSDIIANPSVWFAAAAVVGVCLSGYIVYEAISFEFRRRGYEPQVDMDELQAELDREFAPVRSYSREEMMAFLKARAGK